MAKCPGMDFDFIRPDQPSRCTWTRDADPSTSPHTKRTVLDRDQVLPNILHAIGKTPLVKLNHIPKSFGIKCEMYAKCEFMNPGGSVKDRIGFRMVEDAEEKGLLKPGSTLIEPTSGNTGIGLAMAAAVKGYRCIIVMPEKMSNEKVDTLRCLGAEIIRTPTAAAFDSPEGLIAVAQKLSKTIPNSIVLDQYRNSGNPLAHYDTTIAEILSQTKNNVDMIVASAGTGGTISGIGRKLKESCPKCVLVGVDPMGSILAEPETLNKSDVTFYEVEGIGYDFIPTVLDRSVVDTWEKTVDKESLIMARRLIREEGLLSGGSSGAVMAAALKAAKDLKEGQHCVVLLPDGIRNYMTKMVSDSWMIARDFFTDSPEKAPWWWNNPVSSLKLGAPLTILPNVSVQEAMDILKKEGFDQLPVVDDNGAILGVVSTGNMMTRLVNHKIKPEDKVASILYRQFRKIKADTILGRVSHILEKDPFALVVDDKDVIIAIVSPVDVLSYITSSSDSAAAAVAKASI
ncbi:cystathionine beta-synthase [Neocloeon triangulifer]|uniref:cystathionine beta-synthase n=1 Tax=Neocloeon triangulifer TaxID=2078957 RepID=UPI00286F7B2F|nr:cystathionine beta-synthase [Neocloeon triangulifer]